MNPPDTTQPFRLRDPVAEAQRELALLQQDVRSVALVAAAVRNSKPQANADRRAEAIRRLAFELLVVETIDLSTQVQVLDVDTRPASVSPATSETLSDRWQRAREKRKRKRTRRGAR